MQFIEILQKLCAVNSISGDEQHIIKLIKTMIPETLDYKIDNLYNLIIFNRKNLKTKNKILIFSAIDEPGLIITKIEQDGSLRFETVGKIDPVALVGSVIQFKNIKGVIGQKPIHLQTDYEKNKTILTKDLFIDIGSKNKNETEQFIQLGETATFETHFTNFGNNKLNSKSINSKIGSSILIKLLQECSNLKFDCACLTKSQISNASATIIANKIKPNVAINLNTLDEINDLKSTDENKVNVENNFIINYNPQTNKTLFDLAINSAEETNVQFKIKVNDKINKNELAISQSGYGVKTLTISTPCKQKNSNCTNINLNHLEETFKFIKNLVLNLNKNKV